MPRPEVFLSHASADRESVKAIALQLHKHAVPTWLDEWNLIPGQPFADGLSQALRECSACVVFLGPSGAAPWHREEVRTALNRAMRDHSFSLIPVLLPGARREGRAHLPDFLENRSWVNFAKGLDDADAIHRLVCGIRGIEPGAPTGAMYVPGSNPYRGLRFFDVEDAPLFFGRQVMTEELRARLGPESRFVSIVGPSGSGKSSLARAGLLASLHAGDLPGSAEWPQVIIRPGAFPLESLAFGVASKLAHGADPSELVRRFSAGEEALHREVGLALQGRAECRAVILIDQAEEVFTLCERNAERAAFFANVAYAATVRTGQTLVVLALRADFYARFAEHRKSAALVSENQLLVPPMSEDELREAIALPAERCGRPLRPTLVDELLRDAKGRPCCLPLLEDALAQLWEWPEPALGIEEYRSIGGVAGALNSRAEEVFGKLTTSQQVTCRRLFLRLVQQGEDAPDIKRRLQGTELPPYQREVSQAFAAEGVHLLTWSREGEHEFLEVAHEELIRRWKRLQRWVGEDRLGQRTHRRLMAAAMDWSARPPDGLDGSFLYRGAALSEVEEWLARLPEDERPHVLNSNELAFLEQSCAARDRDRREQQRRTKDAEELAYKRERLRYQIVLVVGGLILGAMAIYLTLATRLFSRDTLDTLKASNVELAGTLADEVQVNLRATMDKLLYFGAEQSVEVTRSATALMDADPQLLGVEIWARSGGGYTRVFHDEAHPRLRALGLPEDALEEMRRRNPMDAEQVRRAGGILLVNASVPPRLPLLRLAAVGPDGLKMVVADIRPARLLSAFGHALRRAEAYLVDANGVVLVHPDEGLVLSRADRSQDPAVQPALQSKGGDGAHEFTSAQGERLGAWSAVHVGRMFVIVDVPREESTRAARDLARRSVLFAFGVLVFALVLSVFFARRLAEPLRSPQ